MQVPGLRDAGWRAGSPIAVYVEVQYREPKTGQQKVQLYCEYDKHCQSGYNLSMFICKANFDALEYVIIRILLL